MKAFLALFFRSSVWGTATKVEKLSVASGNLQNKILMRTELDIWHQNSNNTNSRNTKKLKLIFPEWILCVLETNLVKQNEYKRDFAICIYITKCCVHIILTQEVKHTTLINMWITESVTLDIIELREQYSPQDTEN